MAVKQSPKPKSKFRLTAQVAIIIMIASFPVWMLFLGIWARHSNSTYFSLKESYDYSSRFPFAKDNSHVHFGYSAIYEGTALWKDVKTFPEFRDIEWKQIDEDYGALVRCYKFSKIHNSQVNSYIKNELWGHPKTSTSNLPLYDHRIYRGFFAEQKRESVLIEVFFDTDNNRFFYLFDAP